VIMDGRQSFMTRSKWHKSRMYYMVCNKQCQFSTYR